MNKFSPLYASYYASDTYLRQYLPSVTSIFHYEIQNKTRHAQPILAASNMQKAQLAKTAEHQCPEIKEFFEPGQKFVTKMIDGKPEAW